MGNRNRTNNRPLRDAMEEHYIGWIIGLERVTSVWLIQTMLVQWLLPFLEPDVRLNVNQRDIIAMFRDHLRDVRCGKAPYLGQIPQVSKVANTCNPLLYGRCGRYRRWSSRLTVVVSVREIGVNEAACEVRCGILFLAVASGVHIGCCLNPLEVSFLLFRCVWWLDCLLLKGGASAFCSLR